MGTHTVIGISQRSYSQSELILMSKGLAARQIVRTTSAVQHPRWGASTQRVKRKQGSGWHFQDMPILPPNNKKHYVGPMPGMT
ncbi:hypothetical protein BaRGS_00018853 [Batillaria attramentaria]|uniref:Uncharacterized protein n=1 Tax=Batillaria attramentaria TaxID=370345 RepID=A0ABD0KS53_9CAEN